MRRIFPILFITIIMVSCKPKQKTVVNEVAKENITALTVENIAANHYAVNRNFKTAYIKANVDYTDPKQSLGLSADIRIKKDEIILVSVKMLGITMAKAMITPLEVKYYEKMGGKYFEGDYKTLSNWLGTDLDFQKVQNMLLGQSLDDLNKGKYASLLEDGMPKLEDTSKQNFIKTFVFDPATFWLKRQEIKQNDPARKLLVNYSDYKSFPEMVLPQELTIFAIQDNKTTTINISYRNATFNEELTFPYSVPSGYEKISIE
ncbi:MULTISPECIES: DUF4292 domain-containing protein [Flavobacterium]|uniref:DUF4292 domain-containing protein n=1 Tax=Flavobacterium hankyongi TaxID=1176532 RepID=A0ABP8ZNV9_9FLAO|nr:DUF4292 domain-containing protein [Flavobacterium sp. N1846]